MLPWQAENSSKMGDFVSRAGPKPSKYMLALGVSPLIFCGPVWPQTRGKIDLVGLRGPTSSKHDVCDPGRPKGNLGKVKRNFN